VSCVRPVRNCTSSWTNAKCGHARVQTVRIKDLGKPIGDLTYRLRRHSMEATKAVEAGHSREIFDTALPRSTAQRLLSLHERWAAADRPNPAVDSGRGNQPRETPHARAFAPTWAVGKFGGFEPSRARVETLWVARRAA
jgi:hypothetical protein